MALGTIGVLLILVTGLATTYIRELKLSRTTYDEVIAEASAEGMFEYAMLKVRNHREGFADSVTSDDLDGKMLTLSTDRSKNLKSSYTIEASSTEYIFTVPSNTHLILPLFSSNESQIGTSGKSKNPQFNAGTSIVQWLEINGLDNLSWTIVAMSGSESVGITGSGNIDANKIGTIRHKDTRCNNSNGDEIFCETFWVAEEIPYFYDEEKGVSDFLTTWIVDPYIIIYNSDPSPKDMIIKTNPSTPFALPTLTVTSIAQKNDTLQTFRFVEDKSRYYDALKYGVYAPSSTTP